MNAPSEKCAHCGQPVEDSGDGFHYLHLAGPGTNSKYCHPSTLDENALRGPADRVTR